MTLYFDDLSIKIDYGKGAAVIYKEGKFIKGFASDETETGLPALEKAKHYISVHLNPKS